MTESKIKSEAEKTDEIFNPIRIINLYRHHLRVRDFSPAMVIELQERLLTISKLLGITNVPTIEVIQELSSFICHQYGDFGMDEIPYAFELYAAEKLNLDKKVETFNKFQMRFVGQVLNAYRVVRSNALAKEDERVRDEEYREAKKAEATKTPQQKQAEKNNEAKLYYVKLIEYTTKQKALPLAFRWDLVYEHMKLEGLIKMNNQEMVAFKELVIAKMKADHMAGMGTGTAKEPAYNNPETVKMECRVQYVKNYFTQNYIDTKKDGNA